MNTTNDAHLYPLETAARLYCAQVGQDPDMPVPINPGGLVIARQHRPTRAAWLFVAAEMFDLKLRIACMRAAPVPAAANDPTVQ